MFYLLYNYINNLFKKKKEDIINDWYHISVPINYKDDALPRV